MPFYARWLLLPLPYALCAGIMYSALLIPGGRWLWMVQWTMLGILPLYVSVVAGVAISQYLINSRLHVLLIIFYGITIFMLWGTLWRTLVTSWR